MLRRGKIEKENEIREDNDVMREKEEKRKEENKKANEKDKMINKKTDDAKKCTEEIEKEIFVKENILKRITRAQSKKAMKNRDKEEMRVNEGELDIENEKRQKEKDTQNEVKVKDKVNESEDDKEEKMEDEKEKKDEREVDKILTSEVNKKKKIKKKKEIFTLGVRSGREYVVRTHGIVRRVPKKYKCLMCTDIFKTVKDRNDHVRDIHNIECFKCPDCDQIFKTESSMKRHQFKHKEGGKTYPCSMCKNFFLLLKPFEKTRSNSLG